MKQSSKFMLLSTLFVIGLMALAACQTATPETIVETVVVTEVVPGENVETVVTEVVSVVETVVVEVQASPEPVDRTGAWLDTVIMIEEPSSDAAVSRIEAGDIDVYAFAIADPEIASRIEASDAIVTQASFGGYNDITFMPSSGPEFTDGRLNPFFSDRIREAMNWLIDREFITQEINGGLATPRFVPVNFASKDGALLADVIAAIALKYAYNPELAEQVITEEMEALGAELVDGVWNYNGAPVEIIGLIRTEDERREIGDYVANQLESIGFTVVRDYKTSAEASPCWLRGDPDSGCAHYYTGGWVSTALNRDAAGNFSFFYTPDGLPFPPWQAYSPSDEFYDVSTKLNNSEFATVEERTELMRQALDLALLDSQRIWLFDARSIAPHASNVTLASDLSGSVYGSSLWAQTLRFTDQVGGSMTVAMPSIMTQPWNAIGGSNWVYDQMPARGMFDAAIVTDPFTGLALPNRLARAEVFVQTGLPVEQNLDWATLEFVDEIVVPDDAWADWDAENQVFITAAERFTETTTTSSKIVMYYEDDYFDKMSWHDGSPVTIADHVFFMIMQFDPSKEASPIYDEATVSAFQTFMAAFKGWRIVSENPFVIEYYTDAFNLDAENNVTNFRATSGGGGYFMGNAPWHTLALGWSAEANGELAFTSGKADTIEVEHMSYIAGPSLEILKAYLDTNQAENFVPYAATMSQYVSEDEVASRYTNLQEWFRRRGHFWVDNGPYFLERAFPVEGTLILQRNPEYPDAANRWDRFSAAPIPEVLLDGPGTVAIGDEATFDVFVDLGDSPYPNADLSLVKYLVFDATGQLAFTGEAEAVEDGYFQVTLTAEQTGALPAGSNQLAVIVVSSRALVPVRDSVSFVTE